MKNRSASYWEKRADSRMDLYQKSADIEVGKLLKAYDKALYEIESDIKRMYDKFQRNGKLDDVQARSILNKEISDYEYRTLKDTLKTVKDEKLRRYLLSRLNAPAYKARITRKEAIKESINIQIKKLALYEENLNTELYLKNMNEAYYRHLFDIQKGLGVGFDVAAINTETVQAILNNPWSGKVFSKRIWKNTDVLAEELYNTVVSGILSGKSFKNMVRELEDTMNVSKYAAKRLVKTEATYFSNMAEIQSYKECDIDKYIYIAVLDKTTSKACRKLDGQVFEVDKAVAGENLPPMHPFCRSTTGCYFDGENISSIRRRARDPITGATYVIPEYMTYEQWWDKYVINTYGEDAVKMKNKPKKREK